MGVTVGTYTSVNSFMLSKLVFSCKFLVTIGTTEKLVDMVNFFMSDKCLLMVETFCHTESSEKVWAQCEFVPVFQKLLPVGDSTELVGIVLS